MFAFNTRPLLLAFSALLPGLLGACTQSEPTKAEGASEASAFRIVDVEAGAGDLPQLLASHAAKAKTAGMTPYAELWAEWCGPCLAIQKGLDDPRMKAAFEGAYVVRVDVDAWGEKLGPAKLNASVIPIFYELDERGVPTGRTIDGGAWGDNIPANMAPPLRAFFHPEG